MGTRAALVIRVVKDDRDGLLLLVPAWSPSSQRRVAGGGGPRGGPGRAPPLREAEKDGIFPRGRPRGVRSQRGLKVALQAFASAAQPSRAARRWAGLEGAEER